MTIKGALRFVATVVYVISLGVEKANALSPQESLDEAQSADGSGHFGQALKLYQQAAQSGNSEAMNELAKYYFFGKATPPDVAKARLWWLASAKAGNTRALCDLGIMSENGEGVQADEDVAESYYQQAIDRGDGCGRVALAKMRLGEVGDATNGGPAESVAKRYLELIADLAITQSNFDAYLEWFRFCIARPNGLDACYAWPFKLEDFFKLAKSSPDRALKALQARLSLEKFGSEYFSVLNTALKSPNSEDRVLQSMKALTSKPPILAPLVFDMFSGYDEPCDPGLPRDQFDYWEFRQRQCVDDRNNWKTLDSMTPALLNNILEDYLSNQDLEKRQDPFVATRGLEFAVIAMINNVAHPIDIATLNQLTSRLKRACSKVKSTSKEQLPAECGRPWSKIVEATQIWSSGLANLHRSTDALIRDRSKSDMEIFRSGRYLLFQNLLWSKRLPFICSIYERYTSSDLDRESFMRTLESGQTAASKFKTGSDAHWIIQACETIWHRDGGNAQLKFLANDDETQPTQMLETGWPWGNLDDAARIVKGYASRQELASIADCAGRRSRTHDGIDYDPWFFGLDFQPYFALYAQRICRGA